MSEVPIHGSAWTRNYRKGEATRPDGRSMAIPEGQSDSLDALTEDCDKRFPPAPWRYSAKARQYTAHDWVVSLDRSSGLWGVLRLDPVTPGLLTRATKRTWATSDKARAWAEVRFDRTGAALRGPKPRAGATSTRTLPDVRATEEERVVAMTLAADQGLSFSELVRAMLAFTRAQIEGGLACVVRVHATGDHRIVPTGAITFDGPRAYVGEERVTPISPASAGAAQGA